MMSYFQDGRDICLLLTCAVSASCLLAHRVHWLALCFTVP